MDNKSIKLRLILYTILGFVSYYVFFDYLLPANKAFPKLSLIYESTFELFKHYNLFTGIAITSSVIYVTLSIVLLFIILFKNLNSFLLNFNSFIKVPFFLIILLFSFWFGNVLWAEFLFAFIIILIHLSYKGTSFKNKKVDQLLEFVKLNRFSVKVTNNINGQYAKGLLVTEMRKTHFYLWTFVLIYEFIIKTGGIGTVLDNTFNNYDLAGFISLSLMIYILIYLGDFLYVLIKNKLNY